jgi:hypothetical protein
MALTIYIYNNNNNIYKGTYKGTSKGQARDKQGTKVKANNDNVLQIYNRKMGYLLFASLWP